MREIYIIGESHTRHFAYRKNVFPIFMDSGKTINLENTNIVNSKIRATLDKIEKSSNRERLVFLYLGEPNCRIKLAGHWTPHWDDIRYGKKIDPTPDKEYIEFCAKKYDDIDLSRVDYIISPTCAYDPVIPSLVFLNSILENKFKDKYVNILKYSIDDNFKVLDKYKAKDWEKDPIHLNSRISDRFFEEIRKMNIIDENENFDMEIDGHFGTHLLRCADKSKFGSFIIR